MASASLTTERPNTSAWPSLGSSMPQSMRSVVDLPEPFGPEEAVDASRGNVEIDVIDRDLVAEFSRELPRGDAVRPDSPFTATPSSSVTSTGTPEGSERAAGVVEHHFGEERQPRAVGRGERVVRRELRFARDEAHLALERRGRCHRRAAWRRCRSSLSRGWARARARARRARWSRAARRRSRHARVSRRR